MPSSLPFRHALHPKMLTRPSQTAMAQHCPSPGLQCACRENLLPCHCACCSSAVSAWGQQWCALVAASCLCVRVHAAGPGEEAADAADQGEGEGGGGGCPGHGPVHRGQHLLKPCLTRAAQPMSINCARSARTCDRLHMQGWCTVCGLPCSARDLSGFLKADPSFGEDDESILQAKHGKVVR